MRRAPPAHRCCAAWSLPVASVARQSAAFSPTTPPPSSEPDTMTHRVIQASVSRSFPEAHPLLEAASPEGDVLVLVGDGAGAIFARLDDKADYRAILIELGTECLGVHPGEPRGEEGSHVLGFARFRLGQAAPSNLVEIVRQPGTPEHAVAAARDLFESFGLMTAICGDVPGRIVDRLVRPYYN